MESTTKPDDFGGMLGAFLAGLKGQEGFFPYLHNDMSKFEPGQSWIYYSGPYWGTEEVAAGVGALLKGHWLSAGESVRKFESAFARKIGQKKALMVNSGSSANLVLISALKRRFGWVAGDEIIVSVVGFPTTVTPVIQNGLVPVWVDIEMDSLNFDLDLVEAKITDRTRAIFVSPVLANPPDMDRLIELCRVKGLQLVLDDCDSLGSTWRGKFLNEYAVASSNSFYSSHHLCTGEGGMVVSDDEELMKIARSLAWWGRACVCVGEANLLRNGCCGNRFDRWLPEYDQIVDHRYIFQELGFNLKPLDLQGAIGLVQLEKFDEIHSRRRRAKERIGSSFERLLPVRVPGERVHAEASWFGVPVVCPDANLKRALVAHLENHKIQTRNYFSGNILLHPAFTQFGNWRDYPNASKVLDQVFFVGCAPHYTEAVFDYFNEVLGKFQA
ncbi:MAG: DegT/DnrJ/EryC1/StrS family aminotransferase [Fibrobacterota bacterium]|nr:DegT/DnrJ/EryC1/StrS family aminotransferase [Fibrobacterota bacterium]QQS03816.1 MAG: DegT/DnrJ/EryC1/StrS family aminotransferase [Fibrobacterota bacterium]